MRIPRPRFRLWMMMLVVALVAIGIWGEQMRRRRVRCLKEAARYAHTEEFYNYLANKEESAASTYMQKHEKEKTRTTNPMRSITA